MFQNGTRPTLAADVDLRLIAADNNCQGYT